MRPPAPGRQPTAPGPSPLPEDLVRWMEEVVGGHLVGAARQPGGGRKQAWFVDFESNGGSGTELFLRYDPADPVRRVDPWTVHREASVYQALGDSPVPVPRVLGVHPERQAMLCQRVGGDHRFSAIADPVLRQQTARDFVRILAEQHRLDAGRFVIGGMTAPATIEAAVHRELDEWEWVLAGRGGEVDPALRFTLGWLRRQVPADAAPPALVQGDTGPGNFLFSEGQVVGVVDWELAHHGDPMEDLAWLSLRCTQEPFDDLPGLLADYEERSGITVDEERVWYYRVMAETKLQVMGHAPPGQSVAGAGEVGNALIYRVLHRRLWLEALARALRLEPAPPERPPEGPGSPRRPLYEAVLGELRQVVVPRAADPLAAAYAKGIARAVKYLAEVDAHGAFYERAELADLGELLGERPPGLAEGRRAVGEALEKGRLDPERYLAYLWRVAARDNELARPAMGVLAERHWPDLVRAPS